MGRQQILSTTKPPYTIVQQQTSYDVYTIVVLTMEHSKSDYRFNY